MWKPLSLALVFLKLNTPPSTHRSWLPWFPAAMFILVALCLHVFHFVSIPLHVMPRLEVRLHVFYEQPNWNQYQEMNLVLISCHTLWLVLLYWLHLNTAPPPCPTQDLVFHLNSCEAEFLLCWLFCFFFFFASVWLSSLWLFLFYWNIVDIQYCVDFCYTSKWLRYNMYIFFFILFSIMVYHRIFTIIPYAIQ